MATVEHKQILKAPMAEVWATISAFHGIERWLPAIASSRVDGEGVGAVRACRLHDGAMLRERLTALDEAARTLRYSIIEAPFPLVRHEAVMQLRDAGEGRCELAWTASFDVEGPSAPIEAVFAQAFAAGAGGLEGLHGRR